MEYYYYIGFHKIDQKINYQKFTELTFDHFTNYIENDDYQNGEDFEVGECFGIYPDDILSYSHPEENYININNDPSVVNDEPYTIKSSHPKFNLFKKLALNGEISGLYEKFYFDENLKEIRQDEFENKMINSNENFLISFHFYSALEDD
tara:strand:- start:23 stop:469 length:447 start_codon:yes stop_codon:yes gene_type:complete